MSYASAINEHGDRLNKIEAELVALAAKVEQLLAKAVKPETKKSVVDVEKT